MSEDALQRIQPDMGFDEVGLLRAFDLNRALICATAAKVVIKALTICSVMTFERIGREAARAPRDGGESAQLC